MPHKEAIAIWFAYWLSFTTIATAESVTFTFQQPQNGQRIHQEVDSRTKVQTTFEQSNQLISSESKNSLLQQVREILILEADPSKTVRVQVTYTRAVRKNRGKLLDRPKPQPVAGKTYLVQRIGDVLQVTYPDVTQPSAEEVLIVQANMRAVGRTNPLAKFLDGRTIQIGQRLQLPHNLAADMLGGSDALKTAETVFLTLSRTKRINGQRAAVFKAEILGPYTDDGIRSIQSEGEIIVAIATCRTLRAQMDAKVALVEERGPKGATFTVSNVGKVHLKIEARYEG